MKNIFGYGLTFFAGIMFAGTTAFAASSYVQAQRGSSIIQLNGKAISSPQKLIYDNTTYIQLYAIQSGLQSVLGSRPTWDGTRFNILSSASIGGDNSIQVAFTKEGDHPEQILESEIGKSHSTLDIAIYSITKQDIVDSIVAAKHRGVTVRLITDKTEAGNTYQKPALTQLSSAGIPIKENTHSGLMHEKVSIIDGKEVATGSYNYSTNASTVNDENLIIIDNSQVAQEYENNFNDMWNDTSKFATWS